MTRKIKFAHNVCLLSLLAISVLLSLPVTLVAAQQRQYFPADYLIPPPLPTPQHLKHQNAPAHLPVASASVPSQTSASTITTNGKNVDESPGFMTRIARWFGLGTAEQNQLDKNGVASNNKQSYNYPQPLGADGKPCNLCNKYPWVPMFPTVLQQQQTAGFSSNNHLTQAAPHQKQIYQQQHLEAQASQKYPQQQVLPFGTSNQHLPIKQRAVQFNFPTAYKVQSLQSGANGPLPPNKVTPAPPLIPLPLPFPNLNLNALPPIYNAQPFRLPYLTPAVSPTTTTIQTTTGASIVSNEQQLPSTKSAHFTENVAAPSELQTDRVRPDHAYSQSSTRDPDPNFEIVQSHQVTHFVSSVEYPINYEQSPSIDLGRQSVAVSEQSGNESVATASYQHQTLSPNLHRHLPASQILTELGSFADVKQTGQQQEQQLQQQQPFNSEQPKQLDQQAAYLHQLTLQQQLGITQFPQTYDPTTTPYTTTFVPQTQYQQHNYEPQSEDNFPSASSHNITKIKHLQQNNNYKPWLPLAHTLPYTTTEKPQEYDFSTQLPQLSEVNFVTEHTQGTTHIKFIYPPQSQIPQQTQEVNHEIRETPKRLLDSPILHAQGMQNHPKPFTRDPSMLNLRSPPTAYETPANHNNHKQNSIDAVAAFPITPLLVTPQPLLTPPYRGSAFAIAADPTPTSTYSAIDASGQYAGISPPTPPTPPPARHKEVHQIIIPYTTRNKPRPFEPTRTGASNKQSKQFRLGYQKWATQLNSVDIHEQQESKFVSSKLATETPRTTPPRRTIKYITKILASNLRDLLRREHEVRQNKSHTPSFDLLKLQRNIDNWTEQEYTSLSHRPSTPTIRGRSKHIPTEYLTTTTPSPRRPKTTISLFEPSSELPSSVNDLQALLLERGSHHIELNQIYDDVDHNLLDTLESETETVSSVQTTTLHPPKSNGHAAPSFIHLAADIEQPEPEELWRKAKVFISPQTREKVYVVTPQPRFFPQRALSVNNEQTSGSEKSPRFLERFTVTENAINTSTPATNNYKPEIFGLMGLSAYVPAKPVEIIDGNSKVFNVLTTTTAAYNEDELITTNIPKPMARDEQLAVVKKGRRLRSTMLPSPR